MELHREIRRIQFDFDFNPNEHDLDIRTIHALDQFLIKFTYLHNKKYKDCLLRLNYSYNHQNSVLGYLHNIYMFVKPYPFPTGIRAIIYTNLHLIYH